ncbi:MAG: radical SAM protein [Pseudomonadota bacterium]
MTDFIIISQSDSIDYAKYSQLPIDRIEIFSELVFPRMIYFKHAFHSHLDIINYFKFGKFTKDANSSLHKNLLNIWDLPGFSGMHIANFLLQYNIKTTIINNFDTQWEEFCKIYEGCTVKPLVGISTTFFLSYSQIQRLSKKMRAFDPEMQIIIGGAFANEQAINKGLETFENPMRKNKINFVLHAFNSEEDLKDIIITNQKKQDFSKVCNLAFFEGKGFKDSTFKTTETKWHNPVINNAPALWDRLDLLKINNTVQMRTTSGCPFSCAFCSYPETAKGFYSMSCENVEKHIQSLLKIDKANKIIFIDDTINVPIDRFKELCRMFKKYDFEWFSFLRVQFIDDEIAKLMRDSGCKGVYLGIESGSDTILKNMNKMATSSQFRKGVSFLKRYGIRSIAAFIIGFPGETESTIKETIEFIETSGIDFYTLKEFYYMPHTPIYKNREKYKLTGMGNKWHHNTMDSVKAYKLKVEMIKTVKNSIFVDPDTSLWYLACLYDHDFSMDHIVDIQKSINAIIIDQLNSNFNEETVAFGRLKQLLVK